MSQNWKLTIPSAKVYDIPWKGQDGSIDSFKVQSSILNIPDHTHAHLWVIQLSTFNHSAHLNTLSTEEKKKLDCFIHPVEMENRTKSRIALRLVLAEYLNLLPSTIEFTYGNDGKPELKSSNQKLSFNISHSSDNLVILIDSNKLIGVDIESELKSIEIGSKMAKRFFHQTEYVLLLNSKKEDQQTLFNKTWTLKEAVLKANGTGIFSIEHAPDFSGLMQEQSHSNLQFYETEGHYGFTFRIGEQWLSSAAVHQE
ncbi:MAG: 4'-phosphopantetheinyl transferase [Glaciecola sp.]|jgi:4'-phosphopantetheinyl transferase